MSALLLTKEAEDLAAEVTRLKARVTDLEDALNRDRTGLAAGLCQVRRAINGRLWLLDGRGGYEWDDDRYRAEAGLAMRESLAIVEQALRASGDVADTAIRGKKPWAPPQIVTQAGR